MKLPVFEIIPSNDPKQRIRVQRFFFASAVHLLNMAFVMVCTLTGYFTSAVFSVYLTYIIIVHVAVYAVLRSGFNQRFADPSLTLVQMALAILGGFYLLYYAGSLRGAFWLLSLPIFIFGMFRFTPKHFIVFPLAVLAGNGILIWLLSTTRPADIVLKTELVYWLAVAIALVQFNFVAGAIARLRDQVREKNAALALQNGELEIALKRINDMAIRDELTGVYNRRYITECIAQEAQRCLRNGGAFCICIADIDFFKRINDSYGHLAGDDVLRKVATTILSGLRQTDFFGRFGGEEFIVVLTDTTVSGAKISAERMRQSIEQLVLTHIDQGLQVTISIGIAQYLHGDEPDACFKRADDALYRAKANGRNQCIVAENVACVSK